VISPEACELHVLTVSAIGTSAQPTAFEPLVGPALAAELSANPDTRADTPCLFGLIDESGLAVSWIRAWADALHVAGRVVPWLWTGDLHTRPELRGRGLATRLQRESTAWATARGSGRGSVFSTDTTLAIYRRLGYLLPGYADRRVLIRSVKPLVAGHISHAAGAGVATALAQPAAALATRIAAIRCGRWARQTKSEVRTDASGSALEAVLDAAERRYPLHFNITPAKLQWKLTHASRKGGPCTVLAVGDHNNSPLAMAVVRTRVEARPLAGRYRDFQCTTVLDFVLAERSTRAAKGLVANIVLHFLDRSDGAVLQLISHDPMVTSVAASLGFLRAGRGMSFACKVPDDVSLPADANVMGAWPVTHFSGDGPFF
jgi:GNAT superfamily N-acetyltransferase